MTSEHLWTRTQIEGTGSLRSDRVSSHGIIQKFIVIFDIFRPPFKMV
jgi:hypothetical protein